MHTTKNEYLKSLPVVKAKKKDNAADSHSSIEPLCSLPDEISLRKDETYYWTEFLNNESYRVGILHSDIHNYYNVSE